MADDLQDLKKGDCIVRFGTVHKITKVEKVKLDDGKQDTIIHFEPLYKNRRNETLRLSIPLSSISETTIRRPENKTSVRTELRFLREGEYQRTPFNRTKVKRIINSNELHDVGRVLKTLWEEKRDEDKNFTISKRNTFKMVLRRFNQEVAYSLELSLEDAEEKIRTALDTGWNRKLRIEEEQDDEE